MIRIVPFANWLYGKDMFIDSISLIVLLLIVIYSIRFYQINKSKKQYLLLIASFSLIALSFITKILSHFIIYSTEIETKHIGIITLTYREIEQSQALVFWGLLGYRILSIIGIYLLYLIYSEKQNWRAVVLSICLLLLVGYFGQYQYYIYHFVFALVLLLVLIGLKIRYKEKNTHTTKFLFYGLALIFISHLTFIIMFANDLVYTCGEIIQLVGYLLILFAFFSVITVGIKKTRKT